MDRFSSVLTPVSSSVVSQRVAFVDDNGQAYHSPPNQLAALRRKLHGNRTRGAAPAESEISWVRS
ncbi:hypothetical protein HPP92_003697 [Vanilla planifolia]|uniref:Uncharacterized protein n=1 Tax=Vanilla planifolia TaxID=51239 RepID=A0A835S2V3_VANPL|nr:hypothetical protein HPP92_003697 [Vanilla planifolia]